MKKNDEVIVYGYKEENGKMETVEEQAESIRQAYIKCNEYFKHPPKKLVEKGIEETYECGDMLKLLHETYPHSQILDRETFEKVQEHIQSM